MPISESDRRYLDALYDGSLSYTDHHIGRLATFLRSRARLDRTLIAITSTIAVCTDGTGFIGVLNEWAVTANGRPGDGLPVEFDVQ